MKLKKNMHNRYKNILLIHFIGLFICSCGGNDRKKENLSIITDGCPQEVKIGTQVWMSQNLNVSTFRNGDNIPEAVTEREWKKFADAEQPAWCYYYSDTNNGKRYGKLYNWYAVNDPRGLAPKGWHIPSDIEWVVLSDFLGGVNKAGAKMKSRIGWSNNGNGTNKSCFTGLPGGFRSSDGGYCHIGGEIELESAYWWSSSESNPDGAWKFYLQNNSDFLESGYYFYKGAGLSVRCIKD